MIKTNFLGYQLRELSLNPSRNTWRAYYYAPNGYAFGVGGSPEEACAVAQKDIKVNRND